MMKMGLTNNPVPASTSIKKPKSKTIAISGSQLKVATTGVAVIGPAGVGKTYTFISLIDYLIDVKGLLPEEIHIEYIDMDSGLVELLDQIPFPEAYLDSLTYTLCVDFFDITDATEAAYERLAAHKEQYGPDGCFIIVDNMEKAWEFSRNDVCEAIYSVPMTVKMKEARASQEKAKRNGTKGKPVFNQQLDYAIINPLHNDWAESFKTSGFNFIWMSPWHYEDIKDENDKVVGVQLRFGQKANDLRVSYIIRKYFDDKGKRRVDFFKSRATQTLLKGLTDVSWTGIFAEVAKLAALEKRERIAKMKTRTFPVASQKVENPTQECLDATEEKHANFDDW